MLQMHNPDSLTTIHHINSTNVQYTIIAVTIVILHVIVILKHKIIVLQYFHSPSTNHDHHRITSISFRCQGNHQVFMAH